MEAKVKVVLFPMWHTTHIFMINVTCVTVNAVANITNEFE